MNEKSDRLKVLLDHPMPFALAHGGLQLQIEQTKAALEHSGVEVEWLRWWDDGQTGDLIHYFGRPSGRYVEMSQQKGIRVVCGELLAGLGARSPTQRWMQKQFIRWSKRVLPKALIMRQAWDAYHLVDAAVALTPWEATLMHDVFDAPKSKVHVLPNGVEGIFLESKAALRGQWLVCVATIVDYKRVLELAESALIAGTPLWVIGKPYHPADSYALRFEAYARQHREVIRYEGALSRRDELALAYRQARGFVLLSAFESRNCAAEEAAACECPLLLGDLPWARSVFGETAMYCPVTASTQETAKRLRAFYEAAPALPSPPKPLTWNQVGAQLKTIYEQVLNTSR